MYDQFYEYIEIFSTSYCVNYSDFKKEFTDLLNKHAPKKIKTFRGSQKPHINKTLLEVL